MVRLTLETLRAIRFNNIIINYLINYIITADARHSYADMKSRGERAKKMFSTIFPND